MATTASNAQDAAQDESKKVSFRFCRECSNMLYPLEDQMNHKLMFACRSCQYSEDAVATCIYRNSLKEEVAETAGNVQDVAQDPTVGTFLAAEQDSEEDMEDIDYEVDEGLVEALCTMCGNEITCPICDGPSDGGIMLETYEPELDEDGQAEQLAEFDRRKRAMSGV